MLRITERIIHKALFPLISSGIADLLSKHYKTREEFLAAFLRNRMDLMQEGIPLFKIIFQEMPFQGEIRAMLTEQIKKMPFNEIVDKLREGEEGSGTFAGSPQAINFSGTEVMQILLTCISGFFILRNIMLPELFPKDHLSNDAAVLVSFISRGLGNG